MLSLEMVLALLPSSIVYGIFLGGLYAIIAVGLSMIFGVMKVINLAHGDFAMLGMYITFWLLTIFGVPPLLSLPVSFAVMFAVGFPFMWLVKPLFKRPLEEMINSSVILTYGASLALASGAQMIWTSNFRRVPNPYWGTTFSIGGIGLDMGYTVVFMFAVIVYLMLYFFLIRTKVGKAIRAVSQDPDAAALMGIDVDRMHTLSMGIGLGLAALGGSLLSLVYYLYPWVGEQLVLLMFIICVLGGLGSILGVFYGALIIGLAESIAVIFIPASIKDVVAYAIFLGILLIRPQGLLGGKM